MHRSLSGSVTLALSLSYQKIPRIGGQGQGHGGGQTGAHTGSHTGGHTGAHGFAQGAAATGPPK